MRKRYDFSNAEKNPYTDRLKRSAPVLAGGESVQQIDQMELPGVDRDALHRLPTEARLALVEELWDSIVDESTEPDIPMSPELIAELDRRLKALDEGHERTYSWEEVRDRILKGKRTEP